MNIRVGFNTLLSGERVGQPVVIVSWSRRSAGMLRSIFRDA